MKAYGQNRPIARAAEVFAERSMAARAGASVVDVEGTHAVYVSQPAAVASAIQRAADAL